jgi:hypothetical protein
MVTTRLSTTGKRTNEFGEVTQNKSPALITAQSESHKQKIDSDGQFTDTRVISTTGITGARDGKASTPSLPLLSIFLLENCFLLVTELNMGK